MWVLFYFIRRDLMLTTFTLVKLYQEFFASSSIPVKATPDGFVKLMCGSFMMTIFLAYVVQCGYPMEQVEEWEKETFNGNPNTFFGEVEYAFKMLED